MFYGHALSRWQLRVAKGKSVARPVTKRYSAADWGGLDGTGYRGDAKIVTVEVFRGGGALRVLGVFGKDVVVFGLEGHFGPGSEGAA